MDERKVVVRLDLRAGDSSAISKAFQDAQKDIRDTAAKQLAGQYRNQLIEQEKERLIPTAKAAPGMFGSLFQGKEGGIMGLLGAQVGGAVGGGTGAALGGIMGSLATGNPAGAIISAIPLVVQKLKDLATSPYDTIRTGFQTVTTGMRELGGQLGAGGVFLTGIQTAVEKIPLVGEAAGKMVGAFKEFLETGVQLSALFSPGTSERFKIVQQDTMAVIGRIFTPIVEALTELTKLVGDFLATVLPGTAEMRDALKPLRDIFRELRTVLADVAPIIKNVFIGALRLLKSALQSVAAVFGFVKGLAKGLGLGGKEGKEGGLASSTGMAAREISFVSPDEAAKRVYQAAYRYGQGGDPVEDILADTGNISKTLEEIGETVGQILNAVLAGPKLVAGVGQKVSDLAGVARQAINFAR